MGRSYPLSMDPLSMGATVFSLDEEEESRPERDSAQEMSGRDLEYDCLPEIPPRYDYDFHPARVDPQSFPSRLWSRLLVDSLSENSQYLTQYCDSQGEWDLRCSRARFWETVRKEERNGQGGYS